MIARRFHSKASRWLALFVILACAALQLSCGGDDPAAPEPCPECADDLAAQAYASLERRLFEEINSSPDRPSDIDFTEPHDLYRRALAEDASNLQARFGVALTGLLVLTSDAEVNAAFDEWDAYLSSNTPFEAPPAQAKPLGIPLGIGMSKDALRLPFDVVPMSLLAHGQIVQLRADPQLARIQAILRERVIPRLAEGVDLLAPVGADPDFRFIVTPLMQGDQEERARELDQTDVLAMRAAMSLLSAASRIAVAYEVNFAAYDSAHLYQAFQPGSGWMTLLPDGAAQMSTARDDMLNAIDDVDAALAALLAETDSQDDDIIKRGPGEVTEQDIHELRNQHLPDVRSGLTTGYTRVDDWDSDPATPEEPVTINVGNLLTNPVSDWKALLPSYSVHISQGAGGSNYDYSFGTTNVEFDVPTAGSYSASYALYFDLFDTYPVGVSGPAFMTDVLQQVAEGLAAEVPETCFIEWGFARVSASGVYSQGVQTVSASWNRDYSSQDTCYFYPVIVWDADSFFEWEWPDPTFGGLLPDIPNQAELFRIIGFDEFDFSKQVSLDWGDAIPKAVER